VTRCRRSLLWVPLLGLLSVPASAAVPLFVKLDGRYYEVPFASPPQPLASFAPSAGWFAQRAEMRNCVRSDGLPMEVYLFPRAYVGTPGSIVGPIATQRIVPRSEQRPYSLVELRTVPGNVVCNGEVAAPPGPPPLEDFLLQDGFELEPVSQSVVLF